MSGFLAQHPVLVLWPSLFSLHLSLSLFWLISLHLLLYLPSLSHRSLSISLFSLLSPLSPLISLSPLSLSVVHITPHFLLLCSSILYSINIWENLTKASRTSTESYFTPRNEVITGVLLTSARFSPWTGTTHPLQKSHMWAAWLIEIKPYKLAVVNNREASCVFC